MQATRRIQARLARPLQNSRGRLLDFSIVRSLSRSPPPPFPFWCVDSTATLAHSLPWTPPSVSSSKPRAAHRQPRPLPSRTRRGRPPPAQAPSPRLRPDRRPRCYHPSTRWALRGFQTGKIPTRWLQLKHHNNASLRPCTPSTRSPHRVPPQQSPPSPPPRQEPRSSRNGAAGRRPPNWPSSRLSSAATRSRAKASATT